MIILQENENETFKKTKIVSAFPGCGKTECWKKYKDPKYNFKVLDSDSSTFNKEHFPENYIKHIRENLGKVDVIFISSHKTVRDALKKDKKINELINSKKVKFIVAYPDINDKDEYIERYKMRGSTDSFIKLISDNWESWITDMENEKATHYKIGKKYLSDYIKP